MFPAPEYLMDYLHDRGLIVGANIHDDDGVCAGFGYRRYFVVMYSFLLFAKMQLYATLLDYNISSPK